MLVSTKYAYIGSPIRLMLHGHVSQLSVQLYILLTFSANVSELTNDATLPSTLKLVLQYCSFNPTLPAVHP